MALRVSLLGVLSRYPSQVPYSTLPFWVCQIGFSHSADWLRPAIPNPLSYRRSCKHYSICSLDVKRSVLISHNETVHAI